jgi:hypothetical protein
MSCHHEREMDVNLHPHRVAEDDNTRWLARFSKQCLQPTNDDLLVQCVTQGRGIIETLCLD